MMWVQIYSTVEHPSYLEVSALGSVRIGVRILGTQHADELGGLDQGGPCRTIEPALHPS